MNLIRRLNRNDICSFLCLCLCFSCFACKQTPLIKEHTKSKTEFTIPANSVLSFEKGTLTVNNNVPVKQEISSSLSKIDLDGISAKANADVISKFYVYGGILAFVGVLLLWRKHTKAGIVAISGALLAPLLARYYSSQAAQNVALATLCISGALFFAWHMVKKNLRQA